MADTVTTANPATADDVNALDRRPEVVNWLDRHGFSLERLVFQVEYDVVDCPLIRVWWLTRDEIAAIDNADLRAADNDLLTFANVTDVALIGSLPDWWQPDA